MTAIARQISRWLKGRRPPASRLASPFMGIKEPIEEQIIPHYAPRLYFPVSIGDVLHERYQIIAKLGFGGHSTVWLARDIQRYFVLKLLTANAVDGSADDSELKISKVIAAADPKHEGIKSVRTVESSFEISGPSGKHLGLVYQPMREHLSLFQRRLSDSRIPGDLMKALLRIVLIGLDYLHTKCRVIHTDLKPDNILVGLERQSVIDDLVAEEERNPTPRKVEGDRFIYASRNFGPLQGLPKRPKIADFGVAVLGDVSPLHNHHIQADLLRAPEVILRAGWTYSADIWNLGVMMWDLLENKTLFDGDDPTTEAYSPQVHLQEMVSLLGAPPLDFLQRGDRTSEYFTPEGQLLGGKKSNRDVPLLENSVTALSGEDKRLFLAFARRMLKWVPEERATAGELLQDPWLSST